MALERIDSLFDTQNIQQEFSIVKAGLADSQKSLVDLYNVIKGFKDTTITNLSSNTDKLVQAINGSVQATSKAAQNYEALTQKIAQQTGAIRDNANAITGSNQAYDQLIKQAVRNKLAQEELAQSTKEVRAAFEKGETTFEQYTASLESIKGAQQTLKISNQDITKGLNSLEKQAQSSGTSIDGLKAKLNLLTQAYDKLSQEERASESGSSLLINIQETDEALKKLEADTGRFQRNVGNYSGAFGEAFNVLKEQLAAVKSQMGDIETKGKTVVNNLTGGNPLGFDPNRYKGQVTSLAGRGGAQINVAAEDAGTWQQLANKAQFLENTVERLGAGFKTTRMESRAFQEAAVQLGLAVGQESEEFLVFDKAIGHTQNAINDIKAASKFQASDAKLIKGLADAASTLAGGFAAAQAGAALFAGENEDLQKQMAKFQQLLVLVNGLQAVANGLQTESGGIQLLLSAKTSLLNAAKATQLLLTTRAVQVIGAETAATGTNAIAKEADAAATIEQTVAQEVQTAATVQNTEATIANAAAQGVAKGATTSLSTAIIAGGIAGLAIGAGVALALLTAKLIGYGQQTGLTIKQQEEMAKAMKDANDVIIEQSNFIDELDSSTKKYYQNQLALTQAAGLNQYKQFALEKQLAAAEKQSAQEQIDALGATNKQQAELAGTIQLLNDRKQEAIRIEKELLAIPERDLTGDQKRQLKAAQDNVEFYQKQIDGVKGLYDAGQQARQKLFASNQKEGQLDLQETKFTNDERRRLILETAKLEVDAQKDKNSKILSDQASTLQERLAAIKSNAEQEKKAAQAEFRSVATDPSTTPTQLVEARRKLNAAFAQADRDAAKETQDTNRTYYEKDRDARLEIYKQSVSDSLKYEQDILSKKIGQGENDTTGDAKIGALRRQLELQQGLAEQNRQQDLDAEGLTNEQKVAINKKYNSEIKNLQIDFLKTQRELEKEIRDATLADWDQYYEERKTQLDKETNAEVGALNERLLKRKISQQKYDDELKLIQDHNALDSINLEVMNDYIKVQAYKDGTKEKADAEKKLTADLRAQNDQQTKNELDKIAIARAKVERTLSDIQGQSQNYASAIVDVIDIGYNTQKVRLEELEVRQQRAYETQVKNISDSTATEEQKAIRLKILDDQRATQKEVNDRKQRRLDIQKAQFDKAKDILGIITGTALAVVKALPNIPLAVSVGILGGAELAAAIATPLPHYKEGTLDHPGGGAVTGDGGVKELILEPGKSPRWSASKPTIESLLPHTKVIPPHKIDEWIMSGMFVNQRGVLMQQGESDNKKELRELKEAIIWQTQRLEGAAARNRGRTIIQNRIDTNWGSYINEAVFHRK